MNKFSFTNFRFYASLNDFLPGEKRQQTFLHWFKGNITYGYWLRHQNPDWQLQEILNRFALFSSISPFKRCLRCNGLLISVKKVDIQDQLSRWTKLFTYLLFSYIPLG